MAGSAAAGPPLGTVIEQQDGSHSMWNGKQWAPAAQGGDGNWGVDQGRMAAMGLGGQAGQISPIEAKQVAEMQTNASNMEALADNTADFMARNARTPTGGLLAIPFASKVAKAVHAPGSDDLAAMDRDNIANAVAMRAPGMRLTQMEFGKFMGATPAVQNDVSVNKPVADQIYNGNTLAQAKAAFFATYLNTHRTLAGAIPAWLGWKTQHFDTSGNYSHDPISNKQAAGAALKARSSQGSSAPAVLDPKDYLQ